MEFKDLFGAGPSNYVEYPPKKAGSLEQFFKERTPAPRPAPSKQTMSDDDIFREMYGEEPPVKKPQGSPFPSPLDPKTTAKPVKDEVAATAEAAPKVDEGRLAELKEKFKLQPTAPEAAAPQAEAPAPQAETPAPQAEAYTPQGGMNDLQRSMMSEQASSTATTPGYGDIDVDWIKENAAKLAPESGWQDLLVGMVPAAMDLFMGGGKGYAVGAGGKYLVDKAASNEKRKESLEDKLLALQQARSVASAKAAAKTGKGTTKRFQSVNVVDNDTNEVVKAIFDNGTGNHYSPDGRLLNSGKIRAGFSVIPEEAEIRANRGQTHRKEMEGIRQDNRFDYEAERQKNRKETIDYAPKINPDTGRMGRVVEGKMEDIGPQLDKLNPKQQKDLTEQVNKFTSSDQYKKPAEVIRIASGVEDLLIAANDRSNSTAAMAARKELAKLAEGGGKLTDKDVEEFGGSPSIKNKIKRFVNLQKTGVPLTKEDMQDLREVATLLGKHQRKILDQSINDLDDSNVKIYGGIKGSVREKMKAFTTPQAEYPRTVRKGNQSATVSSKEELQEAMSEGWQ